MLTEWAESGARTHTLGRTWGPRPRGVPLDCVGFTLQDWSPDLRGFLNMISGSLATNADVPI